MTPSPDPQVVVITGASAGVGRAVARAFARRGARIGLIARGRVGLEATRKEVEAMGGQALVLPADVADAQALEDAARQTEEAFGPIDIWVNNAMVTVFGEFRDLSPEEYRRVTDVTYHGQVYGTMVALRRMFPRNRGTIVFVGSALAYRGIPLQSAYCGAKHAVQGMFDSLRTELLHRHSDVRITMVQLPALNTPQFGWGRSKTGKKAMPVPPIFQPEVAAESIVFAATDEHYRREILVGMPTVQAVVGNKVAPGLGDRYLAATGYRSQMRDEPLEPGHRDNLFEPVEGDFGAHGPFGEQARAFSPQFWATKNKRWLQAAGVGLAGVAGLLWARKRGS